VQQLKTLFTFLVVACIGWSTLGHTQTTTPSVCTVTEGGEPSCQEAAGNPIHLATGNKFQREIDMPALPGVLGLELVRTYNSAAASASDPHASFPGGWRLSYDWSLTYDVTKGRHIVVLTQADGRKLRFVRRASNTTRMVTYVSATASGGTIVETLTRVGEREVSRYDYSASDKHSYRFNHTGRLVQIAVPSGEFVSITRELDGSISTVMDPQGRELRIEGNRIHTPIGAFDYGYEGGVMRRLISVKTNTSLRSYHYEDPRFPNFLTGISLKGVGSDGVPMDQRLVSWAYDVQGRAVLSVKGLPSSTVERVLVNYMGRAPNGSGVTLVTNAAAQQTRFEYAVLAGESRLVRVLGEGCASCGPTNIHYLFDKHGNQTHRIQLDAQGKPLSAQVVEYDHVQRIVRISQQRYVLGKAQAKQLHTRYEYGVDLSQRQPVLVAWPSVLSGKERQLELTYNNQEQITKLRYTGFSAQAHGVMALMEQETTYTYQQLNNKSVLVRIDGPLSNGPHNDPRDSDVTQFEYDQKGTLTAQRLPGDILKTFAYDAAGRIVATTFNDGFRQLKTLTTYDANHLSATQPAKIFKHAWLLNQGQVSVNTLLVQELLNAKFDVLGRRTRKTGPDGVELALGYDGANRPSSLGDVRGELLHWAYDTRGNLLAQVQTGADGKVAKAQMWLRDAHRNLVATLNTKGIEQMVVPYELRPATAQVFRPEQHDDFGRKVFEKHPEDGSIATTYERANGELQTQTHTSTDGNNSTREQLHFDFAGRLTKRVREMAVGRECIETFAYEGMLLRHINGCDTNQTYERDAFGRLTATTNEVRAQAASFTERFAYAGTGGLLSRRTVGGEILEYGDAQTSKPTVMRLNPWFKGVARLTGHATLGPMAILPKAWIGQTLPAPNAPVEPTVVQAPEKLINVAHQIVESEAAQVPSHRDGFGRQTRHVPASGLHQGRPQTLTWNNAHQLIAVHDEQSGALVVEYLYDTLGNRVAKQFSPSRVVLYSYDTAHRVIAQASSNGTVEREYLYKGHRVYAVLQGGRAYAVDTDWRGLPSKVKDQDGHSVWEESFDAWGNAATPKHKTQTRQFDMPLRLAGQHYDDETGLHYNIYRYFDPRAGRYISPDPMGTPNGNMRYAYLKGNPEAGIDPLGLFEIPASAFLGGSSYFVDGRASMFENGGHGDIVRIAFALYNQRNGMRFSQAIVDQIVINNYHSDANAPGCFTSLSGVAGGGQCNYANHFDNPNDGPMYANAAGTGARTRLASYTDGVGDNWIQDALDQINRNRGAYGEVRGNDISKVLNAFGQNSHALADFYAHTNWVDAKDRGGCLVNSYMGGAGKDAKIGEVERGFVPNGLAQTRVWQEASDAIGITELFSGTVQPGGPKNRICSHLKGDINCSKDKSAHGYWEKDDKSGAAGGAQLTANEMKAVDSNRQYFWELTYFTGQPPRFSGDRIRQALYGANWISVEGKALNVLKIGDPIYTAIPIGNKHRLAYSLAINHTLQEIEKLYLAGASVRLSNGIGLSDVFKINLDRNVTNEIFYRTLFSKQ
jgi:RHS repeat-associated protein